MNFNEYSKILKNENRKLENDAEKIATAYATAKILGYNKSINNFITEFTQYYEEAISELEK